MFEGPFIYPLGQEKSLVKSNYQLRDYAVDKYKSVDDRPYGGGAGMIMRVDIIDKAITGIKSQLSSQNSKVILLDAGGEKFSQKKAEEFSRGENLLIICGHYEGVDHRVHEYLADEIIRRRLCTSGKFRLW
jgi:tRNA (guanine37-N1)-methyltransferase